MSTLQTTNLKHPDSASNNIQFDSSGRVGLGVASPVNNLDIAIDSNNEGIRLSSSTNVFGKIDFHANRSGADAALGILDFNWNNTQVARIIGSTGTDTTNKDDGALQFHTAAAGSASEAMRIDSNGKLVVGATSFNSGANSFTQAMISGGDGGLIINSTNTSANSYCRLMFTPNGHITGNEGMIRYNTNDYHMAFWAQGNERMRIDSSGNTSCSGNVTSKATFLNELQSGYSPTASAYKVFAGGSTFVDILNNGTASFAAGAFSIASDGDISTNVRCHGSIELDSTGTFTSPKIKLFSNTGAATFASTVQVGGNPFPGTATGFAAYQDGSIALSSASSTGTIFFGYTQGSSTITTQIKANGTASFNGTVSAQGSVLTSDQRFKENITDANPQLADVTALGNKLRNWDWTADAPVADKDTRFLGLVAQEAETVCPGIVTTFARTKDGAELTPEVVVPAVYETRTVPAVLDEKGEVVEAETTEQILVTKEQVTPATYEQLDDSYKGIKNDILIMKLLGAVAELSAKVAALEAG